TKHLAFTSDQGFISTGKTVNPLLGQNPYAVVSYRWAGLDPQTGDPMGYVAKQPSKDYVSILQNPLAEQAIAGPGLPPWFGSIRNSISWKGLSLSANLTYRLGYFFRRNSISYYALANNGRFVDYGDYARRWKSPGDEAFTNVPSFTYPLSSRRDQFYQNSDITVENGSHVRWEDVRLDYTIELKEKKRWPFRTMNAFIMADNLNILLLKKNRVGADPDYPVGLLPSRTFSGGVKLIF
ncbi:MAG TPA: hypothetical protein VMR70_16270, partial [Flavisolibacter sp.]|nr:hypothetical protein [Flavisolibacter sp.]